MMMMMMSGTLGAHDEGRAVGSAELGSFEHMGMWFGIPGGLQETIVVTFPTLRVPMTVECGEPVR